LPNIVTDTCNKVLILEIYVVTFLSPFFFSVCRISKVPLISAFKQRFGVVSVYTGLDKFALAGKLIIRTYPIFNNYSPKAK